jgi:hypothetical protein
MPINVDAYRGYSAALDQLPDHCLSATSELIWSYRVGVVSLCWVTEDLAAFTEVLGGTVPEVITLSGSNRYFVDLESLGSDKIRLYINSPNDGEVLLGYYFSSLEHDAAPYEYKVYSSVSKTEASVSRYTGSGDLISESEGEVQTNVPADWGGPKELLDLCKEQPGTVRILKKTAKDQSYLRVTGF